MNPLRLLPGICCFPFLAPAFARKRTTPRLTDWADIAKIPLDEQTVAAFAALHPDDHQQKCSPEW